MAFFKDINYAGSYLMNLTAPDKKGFKSIVYLHGGGLECGDRNCLRRCFPEIIENGYGIFSIDYPMYPTAKYPDYLVYSAKAIKFVLEHCKEYGGNGDVYVEGESAGGYLVMMLALGPFLKNEGVDPLQIKGWISESGQMTDHFHYIQYEENLNPSCERITEHSPIFYVDGNVTTSPICLLYNKDDCFKNRYLENQLIFNTLKMFKPELDIELHELPGGHCDGSEVRNPDGTFNLNKVIIPWLKNH